MSSRVLVVLGMHRSGTSMLAGLLHRAGLFMGEQLYGGSPFNPSGHFEDREIMDLHDEILAANDTSVEVTQLREWRIDNSFRERRDEIIRQRSNHAQWGWKDPRTCLFLPFWQETEINDHYAIIYRHFNAVIHSYITRKKYNRRWHQTSRLRRLIGYYKDDYSDKEIGRDANIVLAMWITYNTAILKYVVKADKPFSAFQYEELNRGKFFSLDAIHDWGFNLKSSVKIPKIKAIQGKPLRYILNGELVRKAEDLYEKLQKL